MACPYISITFFTLSGGIKKPLRPCGSGFTFILKNYSILDFTQGLSIRPVPYT